MQTDGISKDSPRNVCCVFWGISLAQKKAYSSIACPANWAMMPKCSFQ